MDPKQEQYEPGSSVNQNKPLPPLPSHNHCDRNDLDQESLHRDITNWFELQIPEARIGCPENDDINFQLTSARRGKWVSLPIDVEKGKQWRKKRIYGRPESALETPTLKGLEDCPDLGSLLELVELHPDLQRAFDMNGLPLIQHALKRSVPEQWEFREMSINCGMPRTKEYYESLGLMPDECTHLGWGVESYLQHYAEEMAVCAHVTGLIRERCAGRTRAEQDVLEAMGRLSGPRWKSVHRALWRVWTFCRIFGCAKGREEDTRGQQRWLCGFVGARELASATFTPSDDSSEILCLPPDPFGYGNGSGLSRTEVQDMTAIWTFLEDLLRTHLGAPPANWGWQPEHKGESI